MSDMRKKEEDRQTRTERELAAMGEGRGTSVKPKPKKKKPKPKPHKEKSGVGRDMAAENRARLIRDLDSRIAAARAANNMDLVNKYEARKKALKEL